MTEELAWSAILGPFIVGLILWGLALFLGKIAARRARRRQIVALMGRARAVAFRAIRDGLYDAAYVADSDEPLAAVRAQYDDLTAEALALFERNEEVVAYWTSAEFFAGWEDPLYALEEADTPRTFPPPGAGPLVDPSNWLATYELARPGELAAWADAPWPLAWGDRGGPRYGDAFTPGDIARHRVIHPNTDNNQEMIMSWVHYVPNPTGGPHKPPSKWDRIELRRLRKRYPEHAERYPPRQ